MVLTDRSDQGAVPRDRLLTKLQGTLFFVVPCAPSGMVWKYLENRCQLRCRHLIITTTNESVALCIYASPRVALCIYASPRVALGIYASPRVALRIYASPSGLMHLCKSSCSLMHLCKSSCSLMHLYY
ncbi:hypothetical protein AVEN_179720-1 [Araneus ventricosus]|uniref:Uncharacterized protein n=1 Tax=Araneus ventricosus TaxID=182803 RepID=A0A4Y2VQU2_ARAVE|nr:hypothetical protein AVEN_179720-1 [Araneus ventricosus]